MKKSNEAIEIEQLKHKIEKYRKALASASKESSSGDIHLRRKVSTLEKNVEQLNVQIQELGKLVDNGIALLSKEIRELEEKVNDQLKGKKATVPPRMKSVHSNQNELPSIPSTLPEDQTTSHQNTIPTFSKLRQLAALQPSVQPNELPKPPRYNVPAVSSNPAEIREIHPVIHEEAMLPSRGEDSDAAPSHYGVPTSRTTQEIEKTQPVQQPAQLYAKGEIQDSPFWKKFKKK